MANLTSFWHGKQLLFGIAFMLTACAADIRIRKVQAVPESADTPYEKLKTTILYL